MATRPDLIQLDPRTAEALADYAASLGMSVPDFLRKHFGGADRADHVGDADAWLDDISEGLGGLMPLPADFSTKDMYADHD